MSKPVARKWTCWLCGDAPEIVEGMVVIHCSGMPPLLCFGCVDLLGEYVAELRAKAQPFTVPAMGAEIV
jgi:hypothetical protein